jgi:predicted amidohydrolase
MTAHRHLRVAAAQYPLDPLADMAAVRDKLARWVGEAVGQGAELIVFPEYGAMELAATAGSETAARLELALPAVSSALPELDAACVELAYRHKVHIVAASGPQRREDDGAFVNAARLITPTGRIGTQHKLIMTPFERDWGIAPGEALHVFETELGRIGIAICYDSEFPLVVRAGADIIVIPSCTERLSGANRVRTAAMARALENGCATVVSPTVGEALWCPAIDYNTGMAGIYVPAEAGLSESGVLAEGQINASGWVCADIDLQALAALRSLGEMRNAQDWRLQPGACALDGNVQVVPLG